MTCSTPTTTAAADAASAACRAEFDQRYEAHLRHLRHLRLKGMRPKTIEAYARGIRRMGEYLGYRVDSLSGDQLSCYFSDLLSTHSSRLRSRAAHRRLPEASRAPR
jgi:hypothetical protein